MIRKVIAGLGTFALTLVAMATFFRTNPGDASMYATFVIEAVISWVVMLTVFHSIRRPNITDARLVAMAVDTPLVAGGCGLLIAMLLEKLYGNGFLRHVMQDNVFYALLSAPFAGIWTAYWTPREAPLPQETPRTDAQQQSAS